MKRALLVLALALASLFGGCKRPIVTPDPADLDDAGTIHRKFGGGQSSFSNLQKDPPVDISGYRPNADDRRKIDNQILALQDLTLQSLLRGTHASFYLVDAGSETLQPGDVVCLAGSTSSERYVTKAFATPLSAAGKALGVATQTAGPGSNVLVAIGGVIGPTISHLAAGASDHSIRVSASATLEAVTSFGSSDFPIGTSDAAGNVTIGPQVPLITGGGGGGGGSSCAVADLAGLRAIGSGARTNNEQCGVSSPLGVWSFHTSDGTGFADDGFTVVKPNDVLVGSPGRWYPASSGATVPTMTALRAAVAGKQSVLHVQAFSTIGDSGGGDFELDPADVSSADDGGTVIVAGSKRYRRQYSGGAQVTWFGADKTGGDECATAFTAAANAVRHVYVPPGAYKLASGWTVPRSGITIELADGARLNIGGTLLTNVADVKWLGHSYGRNFNSDALGEWHPNVVWTGGAGVAMGWAVGAGVSADGSYLDGILIDGAAGLASQAHTCYLLGTASSGASGVQFDHFAGIDCWYGANFRTNFEQSSFHQPYFGFRSGISNPLAPLGIGIGADPSGSFSITSSSCADWGGSVSGYKVGVQIGGTGGSASTIDFGGGSKVVIESGGGSGIISVLAYNGLDIDISKLHVEVHPVTIIGTTGNAVNPTVVQTDVPHGIPNGATVRILGVTGNTAANGERVGTVVDTTHVSVPVAGNGTYAGGGSIVDISVSPNTPIVLGSGSATPESVRIHGNYLAGAPVSAIRGVNWDSPSVWDNTMEVSGANYAFKTVAGSGRRVNAIWGTQRKVARGANYITDIQDRTGFDYVMPQNRAAANESLPEIWTSGRMAPQGGWQFSSSGTAVPVFGNVQLGETYTITGATNASPIVVHTSAAHRLRSLDAVHISGVLGNTATNGDFFVTYVAASDFSLNGSTGNGAYTSGGVAVAPSTFIGQYMPQFDVTMGDGALPVFRLSDNSGLFLFNRDAATATATQQRTNLTMYNKYWDPTGTPQERNAPLSIATTIDTRQTDALVHVGIAYGNGNVTLWHDAQGDSVAVGAGSPPRWFNGTGVPNFTAPFGSFYSRADGNTGTSFYVNEGAGSAGSGNNWVPKIAAPEFDLMPANDNGLAPADECHFGRLGTCAGWR